eukprot:TRINITY_DN17072_c0_g1_i1.p2 TRINITY_DN17072_c0_g1~~TRINITY_DN17072_c0_g1_i1.p2  ORF type:complete len:109 (+),score=13.24 TRINITY_DN17072_c0_g1_i1:180-506(+)
MLPGDHCERNSQAEIVPFEKLQRYLGDEWNDKAPNKGQPPVFTTSSIDARERLRCLYARIRPRDRRADDPLRLWRMDYLQARYATDVELAAPPVKKIKQKENLSAFSR